MAKIWTLLDFKAASVSASGKPFMSLMAQDEYDCKEERSRNLFISWYSRNMGRGEVVYVHPDHGKWMPIPPGSTAKVFQKIACRKR